MASPHSTHAEVCPYCSTPDCQAEYVDVGIGLVQCAPFHCENCGATEIGPYDTPKELSEAEKKTGWYAPGNLPDSVSTLDGKYLDSQTALELYRKGFAPSVPFRLTSQDLLAKMNLSKV